MFDTPTLDETHETLIAHYRTVMPEADVAPHSYNWLFLRTLAMGVTMNHAHIFAVKGDLMPDTSEGDMLDRWAAIRGVTRKAATGARKADALRVVGMVGTTIPDATELTAASGLRFQTFGANVIGAAGHVDVDIIAIDTGSVTRLAKGEVLTFSVPIVGVEEQAELQLTLDEDGTDQESDAELRERVLSRFRSPPLGGAAEDYVQWAGEEVGISDAYAYPLRRGVGSIDVVALHDGSGSVRVLTEGERAALEEAINDKRPVSVGSFRVLTVVPTELDVEVTIVPQDAAEHEFDWLDSTPPTVLSYDAVTRKLRFDGGTRPATMDAGDRLIVKKAGGAGTGRERIIEALTDTAGIQDAVILELDATGDVPAPGDTIYSGGPLVQPVRAAIQAFFDDLGPANSDENPYGPWEGSVDPESVGDIARDVDGVRRATTIAPAVKVDADDPAYPDDDEIGLLIAGRILVRRKW